jgi:predicted GNAT family N-acyltransferase
VQLFLEKLCARHKKSDFCSGISELDGYLQRQAGQDAKRNLSAVHVLADEDGNIIGYYTLSQNSIVVDELPEEYSKRLPPNRTVACTLLGRLAVDRQFQGRGYGRDLLFYALKKSAAFSQEIASYAVVVDAIGLDTKRFYLKYGFMEFASQPLRLFLPTKTISNLIEQWHIMGD